MNGGHREPWPLPTEEGDNCRRDSAGRELFGAWLVFPSFSAFYPVHPSFRRVVVGTSVRRRIAPHLLEHVSFWSHLDAGAGLVSSRRWLLVSSCRQRLLSSRRRHWSDLISSLALVCVWLPWSSFGDRSSGKGWTSSAGGFRGMSGRIHGDVLLFIFVSPHFIHLFLFYLSRTPPCRNFPRDRTQR